jgi:hypothetical protein
MSAVAIPVSDFDDVRIYWVRVRRKEAALHGYLLYAGSDHRFPEYMAGEGMGDLDAWSGESCGIFIFQTPPEGWVRHAAATESAWAALVRERFGPAMTDKILEAGTNAPIELNGRQTTLRELFAGCSDYYLQRDLIQAVLRSFNLPPTRHPCLIFFTDLNGQKFWHARLDDLLEISEGELRKALNRFFARPDFLKLVREAQRAKA